MGETYRTFFSDTFNYDTIGQITGASVVSQFPNMPGSIFRLQGHSDNLGSFFIGTNSGTGKQYWEIEPSVDTGWFTLDHHNLNELFFINSSGSSEKLNYWVQH